MQIKVSGGQFFVNGYPVKRGFTLEENEERTISYIAERGAGCARLSLTDGKLSVEGEIGRVDWKGGVELYPLEDAPVFAAECDVQGEKVLVRFGRELTVGGFRYEPILPLYAPSAQYLGGQRLPLLKVQGQTSAGDYLAILSLRRGAECVLLEGYGEITANGNEVTVTRQTGDLRGRKISDVYLWQGESFARTTHTCECAYTGAYPREMRGRLLLEAVMAEDEADVRMLTTAELSDLQALKAYFGDIERVREPLFPASPTAASIQKRTPNGRVAVTYDFSFEGDKIENILSPDE